jgi:nucleotide-binding universal stress UspA family protein
LAREVGAKLHLFHACEIGTNAAGVIMEQSEIEKQIEAARKKMDKRYISKMNGYDNYDVEVREGIPYVEILKFAREKTGDLIVMAHHTREIDPEEAELGSTVAQVVLRSACPVASVNHPDKVAHL